MGTTGVNRIFKRKYLHSQKLIESPNFAELKDLVCEGQIFPAIRENVMDFYYSGQRAFRRTRDKYYTNDFFLNGRREPGNKSRDLSFNELPYINSYGDEITLSDILKRCKGKARKGSPEGFQLSKLFPFYSFACNAIEKNIPLLVDVEARFSPLEHGQNRTKADMVDLVFLLPESKELLFIEGKRRNDSRIRSSSLKRPEVVTQVSRYRDQLEKRKEQILSAYTRASIDMKQTFGFSFPEPKDVLPQVPILVVGDDDSDMALEENPGAKDIWLEPMLKKPGKNKYHIWEKNNTWLIDARAIFNDPINRMRDFAEGLFELARKIR